MRLSFKRIVTSGTFIPQIDGLRFVAIVSVVCFHLAAFFSKKDTNVYEVPFEMFYLKRFVFHGHYGVQLFFIISGLVLGLPFVRWYTKSSRPIKLKSFYSRRITRLEPPYILVMTALFFASVYFAKTISFQEGLKSYLASITYTHNLIYGKKVLPLLAPVAWSLEIEIQFYLIVPIIALIFKFKKVVARRLLLIAITLALFFVKYLLNLPFVSLIDYISYFLSGLLLADLYISEQKIFRKSKFDGLIGLTFFIIIWTFDVQDFDSMGYLISWNIIQLFCMFFFCYYVVCHKTFKVLSTRWVTNIGGMCYSIYLLHYPIISMFGNPILKLSFSKYQMVNLFIYSVILIAVILIVSSLFFLLVERPCMNKDWVKDLFKRKKLIIKRTGEF